MCCNVYAHSLCEWTWPRMHIDMMTINAFAHNCSMGRNNHFTPYLPCSYPRQIYNYTVYNNIKDCILTGGESSLIGIILGSSECN